MGLGGKADRTVCAYAWREKRVVLTHDKDYLNDRVYPFYRHPGAIVLPGEEGEQVPLRMAVRSMLSIFGTHGRIFPNAKIVIDSNNVWYIKDYRKADGCIEHAKLMFTKGKVYCWDD